MRRSWDWLHSWAHPDEAMLARLWSARRIDLHHPRARGRRGPRHLADYLNRQWRRHLVWLIVNGVIAPFSVILAILPGPNLIGYWFAYRAIHHSLVVWGIRRVQQEQDSDRVASRWRRSICRSNTTIRARPGTLRSTARRPGSASTWTGGTARAAWMIPGRGQPPGSTAPSKPQLPRIALTSSKTGDHAPSELQHS